MRRCTSPWPCRLRIEEKYEADSPTEKYNEVESDVVQPAVGWWWTAADKRDGASGRLSFGVVTRLQLGTDVARVSTAVGSRCGLEYEPLRVCSSSRLSSVSVLVCVLVSVSLNHDNDGKG